MDALIHLESRFGPRETMDWLETQIRSLDMQVFIRIDHAAGAAQAGMELGPTELILFGNARAGTPLMQMSPAVGLDLPLKALVWQDAAGKTWLTYLPPVALASRNGLGSEADQIVGRMTAVFEKVAGKATGP